MTPPSAVRATLCLLLAGCAGPSVQESGAGTGAPVNGGFSSTAVFPGHYDLSGPLSKPLGAHRFEIAEPDINRFPSPVDGTELVVATYLPVAPSGTRFPVLARISPYFGDMTPASLDPPTFGKMLEAYENLVKIFVPQGFAVALVPVRGTSNAGGCLDLLGPTERSDTDATLTWLGTRPWSNGRVAVVGLSNEGATTWVAASTGNPYLKTIVPMATWPDTFQLQFANGSLGFLDVLYPAAFYGLAPVISRGPPGSPAGGPRPQQALCPTAANAAGAYAHAYATRTRDPFGFFEGRDHRSVVKAKYDGSVLVVHGLQDWAARPANPFPFVNELQSAGVPLKTILGQWHHDFADELPPAEPASRWDWAEILLHWFDYWLRDDSTVDLGPPVQVQDSDGAWRSEADWPPARANPLPLFLAPGGRLLWNASRTTQMVPVGPDPEYRFFMDDVPPLQDYDRPRSLPCPTCASFVSDPMPADVRFAGPVQVPLTFIPTGPGGEVGAYLYSVPPNGAAKRLGWGQIDLRFADGTETPKIPTPGQPVRAKLQLEPLDAVVHAGSRILLIVVQGVYGDDFPAFANYPMQMLVGAENGRIRMEAFGVEPASFFDPPRPEGGR